MRLTAVLIPAPEGEFIAFNPETGTTTQGESGHTKQSLTFAKLQNLTVTSFREQRTTPRDDFRSLLDHLPNNGYFVAMVLPMRVIGDSRKLFSLALTDE